jgi:hypothetical protein
LAWLRLASALHPSAGYLQALLGPGREAKPTAAEPSRARAEAAIAAGDAAAAQTELSAISELSAPDAARALGVAGALRQRAAVSPRVMAFEAEALEICGDYAGAWLAYQDVLREGSQADVQRRAQVCALELALRASARRRAYGNDAAVTQVLTSRLGRGSVPRPAVPDVDASAAAPWLELQRLYAATGRPLLAYQAARAARTREPRNPETYAAVEVTAQRLGAEPVVKLAREHGARASK